MNWLDMYWAMPWGLRIVVGVSMALTIGGMFFLVGYAIATEVPKPWKAIALSMILMVLLASLFICAVIRLKGDQP